VTKRKKAIDENELIKTTPQPFKTILIILCYYTKELLAIILLTMICIFIIFNFSCDPEHGPSIKPSIKVEVTK